MNAITIRPTTAADGAAMWRLADASDALEANTAYCYLIMAKHFSMTCLVAEKAGHTLGYAMGYRPPAQPETVFVWQIGVASDVRGQGIAGRLLDTLATTTKAVYIEASIGVSNTASQALFNGFARRRKVPVDSRSDFLNAAEFPAEHETEKRFVIGPLKPVDQGCSD